jgi:hypothetical protein
MQRCQLQRHHDVGQQDLCGKLLEIRLLRETDLEIFRVFFHARSL